MFSLLNVMMAKLTTSFDIVQLLHVLIAGPIMQFQLRSRVLMRLSGLTLPSDEAENLNSMLDTCLVISFKGQGPVVQT